MAVYKREKCLCCECKNYEKPCGIQEGLDKFPHRYGCTTIGSSERCQKGECAIADRVAKGNCKYFEVKG